MYDRRQKYKTPICRNCGSPVSANFCASCGQSSNINLSPTLKDIFHDLFHEVTHLDGKIFQTFKQLFRHPGKLTSEYLAGRRKKYINPLRVYLTCSLIFFSVSTATGSMPFEFNIQREDPNENIEAIRLAPLRQVARGVKRYQSDPAHRDVLAQSFMSVFPKMFLLFVPILAGLLKLSYWRRGKPFAHYFYFSLHYYAAHFACLSVVVLMHYLFSKSPSSPFVPLWTIYLTYGLLYTWFALRRVWGDSGLAATIRSAGLTAGLLAVTTWVIWIDLIVYFYKMGKA